MPITIQVFDPALCCSTGICGPSVDPSLVRFAADLEWLKSNGISVERFNLAQQPGAFAASTIARQALESKGDSALPLIVVNGEVKSSGNYPSRSELADWAAITCQSNGATATNGGGCCGTSNASDDAPKKSKCCC